MKNKPSNKKAMSSYLKNLKKPVKEYNRFMTVDPAAPDKKTKPFNKKEIEETLEWVNEKLDTWDVFLDKYKNATGVQAAFEHYLIIGDRLKTIRDVLEKIIKYSLWNMTTSLKPSNRQPR